MRSLSIAYNTIDEVNLLSAKRAARACGATLSCLAELPSRRSETIAGVLHDLDHHDRLDVNAIVHELLRRPAPYPVAVHGYSLNDEATSDLRTNGVIVSHKLSFGLVSALCRAADGYTATLSEPSGRRGSDSTLDPAVLCGMVRSLATHAYGVLRKSQRGAVNLCADQLRGLMVRIDEVQQLIDEFRSDHGLAFEDLQRWIESLRRYTLGLLDGHTTIEE